MTAEPAPREDPPALPDPDAQARLLELRARYRGLEGEALLRPLIEREFPGRIAVVSSFGAESAVLLHMVAGIDPTTPVLFLNTGKLFGETLRYRDRLQNALGLTDLRALHPHPADEAARDPDGTLWARDPDACCALRKVLPLRRALRGFAAEISGRKRFQTKARSTMETLELQEGRIKVNPLASLGLEDLAAYAERHRLPPHPLVADGYLSIGCMPCTARVKEGEGYRSGRWVGRDKDECGIHGPALMDGEGI